MNKKLIILEMANNHYGDVEFGKQIIRDFSQITRKYTDYFDFAFKFQLRNIDTFIHPEYKDRMDLKYVKRFSETNLSAEEFAALKQEAEFHNYITICTAFDEPSVDLVIKLGFAYIKIASCSLTDWLLLNKIAEINLPIIASTAGSSLEEIDNVVSFFNHRNKNLSLMHCIGEYPTKNENCQLNQIDLLKQRYSGLKIGLSLHEMQGYDLTVQLAIAKGIDILEKHVVIGSNKYSLNAYSTIPERFDEWLSASVKALIICGVQNERHVSTKQEINDLLQFKRGVFVKSNVKKGETINRNNVFYAWPNVENQVLANDMSKYVHFIAQEDISFNKPLLTTNTIKIETRKEVWDAVQRVKGFILDSGVVFPESATLELSHHYGIEKFYETGISMITVVNREYCKKLIVMLPGQKNPEHCHKLKDETFFVLNGSLILYTKTHSSYPTWCLTKGHTHTINPNTPHWFSSPDGCVIEELSTHHGAADSYYTDTSIMDNKDRKTIVNYWL